MHNQKHSNRSVMMTIIAVVAALLVGFVAFLATRDVSTEPESESESTPKTALFSFDTSKAPGWYKSPLDASSAQGRRSLLVFDFDFKSPKNGSDMRSCHLSAFLNPGSVDIDEKREAVEQIQFDNRKASLVDTLDMSLQMSSESKKYTLYRYKFTGGSAKFKNGNAFGYVQLDKHYVEMQVVCDTFEQLDSATDALKAVRFDDKAPRD